MITVIAVSPPKTRIESSLRLFLLGILLLASIASAEAALLRQDAVPTGVDSTTALYKMGFLDVTQAPYAADPTGRRDSTAAIQNAVIAAREAHLVCFFPSGTYLISDTISCEQAVYKLPQPRKAESETQHYWGDRDKPCILVGSTKSGRPVLKLVPKDNSFDDPAKPKPALFVWAQTRNDIRTQDHPEWGKEQANISFNQIVRGIDLDVRGHAGAIGLRHAGSQGSTAEDMRILAEGALAGMYNCPGQGGGTHNIEVVGGDYGLYATAVARFVMLAGCSFKGQSKAAIRYDAGGLPMVVVGFQIEQQNGVAIDVREAREFPGVVLTDGVISMNAGQSVFAAKKPENIVLKNVWVKGAKTILQGSADITLPSGQWTHVETYAATSASGQRLIDGGVKSDNLFVAAPDTPPPDFDVLRRRHIWDEKSFPSFEDADAINVKTLGAKGDGKTDDTAALKAAIATHKKIFLPKGTYIVSDTLELGPDTQFFGVARIFTDIRAAHGWGHADTPIIATVDRADARTTLANLSISHDSRDGYFNSLLWRAGRHSMIRNVYLDLFTGGARGLPPEADSGRLPADHRQMIATGNGGGRWWALNYNEGIYVRETDHSNFRVLLIKGTTEPLAIYPLNAERAQVSPMIEVIDSRNVDIYYLKGEGLMLNGLDCRGTLIRIQRSKDISVYAINGNIDLPAGRALAEVIDSGGITLTTAGTFKPNARFNVLKETINGKTTLLDATVPLSLYERSTAPH